MTQDVGMTDQFIPGIVPSSAKALERILPFRRALVASVRAGFEESRARFRSAKLRARTWANVINDHVYAAAEDELGGQGIEQIPLSACANSAMGFHLPGAGTIRFNKLDRSGRPMGIRTAEACRQANGGEQEVWLSDVEMMETGLLRLVVGYSYELGGDGLTEVQLLRMSDHRVVAWREKLWAAGEALEVAGTSGVGILPASTTITGKSVDRSVEGGAAG